MHYDGAASTVSIDITDLSFRDLEKVGSASLRRVLEEFFEHGADLEPSAGFDSSI
ncbi:hypothetical protein [Streptosporangium sp. NPDC000563]|uniref:hypothetical protein n=1 Tax=unclassified Streptosporangium TaxID=2632669 RepID=UPI003318DF66